MTNPARTLLTFNSGSSSLRFAVLELKQGSEPLALLRGQFSRLASSDPAELHLSTVPPPELPPRPALHEPCDHQTAIALLLDWLSGFTRTQPLIGTAHRVVHGGMRHAGPAFVDDALLDELEALAPLAPLHQPNDLAAIRALHAALPDCPQVACFDTAFHRSIAPQTRRFPLPAAALPAGAERFGFHGLSYQHVANEMARLAPGCRRVVALHLGNGSSLCAMRDGTSVDTTMGLTPLDGVPMGTRSGALDPGLLLALMEQGWDFARLVDLLYRESGLLALSGISSDMRLLLASSDRRAAEAVEFFAWRCAQALAAMAVSLGGLDAVVFTGGIGEHAAPVRERILRHCAWLGISVDPAANATSATRITAAGSTVAGFIIPADEERVLAAQALALLRQQAG